MTRRIAIFFATALFGLNLNACAGLLQDMARRESAGYLGCRAHDITIAEMDPMGSSYRATCHGHAMICSATGAGPGSKERQVHCADVQAPSDQAPDDQAPSDQN